MASNQRYNEPIYSPPAIWANNSWPEPQNSSRVPAATMTEEPERQPTPERRRNNKEYLQNGAGVDPDDYFNSRFGRPGGGAPRRDDQGNQVNTYGGDREVRFVNGERIYVHDSDINRFVGNPNNQDNFRTAYLRDLNQQIQAKHKRLNADKEREQKVEAAVIRSGDPFLANRTQTPPKYGKTGLPALHGVLSPEPIRQYFRSPSPPLHGALMEQGPATIPNDKPYEPIGPFRQPFPPTASFNSETGKRLWPQEEPRRNVKPWPSFDNVFTTEVPRAEQYERKSILLEGDNERPRYGYNVTKDGRGSFGLPQTLKFHPHLTSYPDKYSLRSTKKRHISFFR